MKKWITLLFVLTLFIGCGDNDEEDFDPTRLDIVTGLNLKDNFGQAAGRWGNPNVTVPTSVVAYPNPVRDALTVRATTGIQNIWIVNGLPSRNFPDTNFTQVFADNPFQQSSIEAVASRSFDNLNGNNIAINLEGISQGYYRLYVQLQNGSIISDNIYITQTGNPDLEGINFWE